MRMKLKYWKICSKVLSWFLAYIYDCLTRFHPSFDGTIHNLLQFFKKKTFWIVRSTLFHVHRNIFVIFVFRACDYATRTVLHNLTASFDKWLFGQRRRPDVVFCYLAFVRPFFAFLTNFFAQHSFYFFSVNYFFRAIALFMLIHKALQRTRPKPGPTN